MKKSMNKGPFIIFGLIIVLAIGLLFYKKPILDTVAQQKYGAEIEKLSKIIAEKKCEAGDEVYIALAQDYGYIKDFKRALATYDTMSQCYPNAYQVLSDKYKLLLNNRASLYADWGYYLKNTENDPRNAEKKYQEAVKIFKNIIQTFRNTDGLSIDEIKWYENRIEQIEKYHLGKN
jgi:tetratricopeptide (TPR) repeat protein